MASEWWMILAAVGLYLAVATWWVLGSEPDSHEELSRPHAHEDGSDTSHD